MLNHPVIVGIFGLMQKFWNVLRDWSMPFLGITLFEWMYMSLAVTFIILILSFVIGHKSGPGSNTGSGSGGDKKISSERQNDEK